MINESRVLEKLKSVIDPDLDKNIVELGFVKNLKISPPLISFSLELTTPGCPVKEVFRKQCHDLLITIPEIKNTEITITSRSSSEKNRDDSLLKDVKNIIAISSCKGGVGKSTLAAFIAMAMNKSGLKVGLLDADIYGPSLPCLFQLYNPTLEGIENNIFPINYRHISLMSLGFLMGNQPAVLRGAIVSNYMNQMLTQTIWGELDYLIIDFPPGTGDIQLTITQTIKLDGAVIVTTPHTLATADVERGILMFDKVNVNVLGTIENMSYLKQKPNGEVIYPFGQPNQNLNKRYGIEVIGQLPLDPVYSQAPKSILQDEVPNEINTICEKIHRELGKSKIKQVNTQPLIDFNQSQFRIRYTNGQEKVLSNHLVRSQCQCAMCIDEFTGETLLNESKIPKDIQPTKVSTLGNYAVSIEWNDGHRSGIYTYKHLDSIKQV